MPKGRKRIMRKFTINEISGVDVPAQEGAKALIMKRGRVDAPVAKHGIVQAVTGETGGHRHGIEVRRYSCDDGAVSIWVGHARNANDEQEHSHSIMVGVDGSYTVLENAGHTHMLDAAALTMAIAVAVVQKQGDEPMTPEEQKKLDDLAKASDRMGKIILLKAAARMHFDGLADVTAQDAFLAKSVTDQEAEVVKAKAASDAAEAAAELAKADKDPILHTTADGIEIRKSDGAGALALAKARDADAVTIAELTKTNKELAAATETGNFVKRAETELTHLPGTVQQRAALLKAAEGIDDEETRKAAVAALKSQNKMMAPAFGVVGVTSGDINKGGANPQTKLDELTAEYQKANSGVTVAKAQTEVLRTPEGGRLYAQIIAEEGGVPRAA